MKQIQSLGSMAGVEYNGKVYFSSFRFNGLFEMDLATQKVRYAVRFHEEKEQWAIYYRYAFLYENEAWFIPMQGAYIVVVNLDSFEVHYIEPPGEKKQYEGRAADYKYFQSGMIGDKYIYLIPTDMDTLLIIDMETKEVHPIRVSLQNKRRNFGAYDNGKLFIKNEGENRILIIDLNTKDTKEIYWDCSGIVSQEITCADRKLWMCPGRESFIQYMDLETEKIECISLGEFYEPSCIYQSIETIDNKILFLPATGYKVLLYDTEQEQLSEVKLGEDILYDNKIGLQRISSNSHILFSTYSIDFEQRDKFCSSVLFYHPEEDYFESVKVELHEDEIREQILEECDFILEDAWELGVGRKLSEELLGLKYFIRLRNPQMADSSDGEYNNGKMIWQKIKG